LQLKLRVPKSIKIEGVFCTLSQRLSGKTFSIDIESFDSDLLSSRSLVILRAANSTEA